MTSSSSKLYAILPIIAGIMWGSIGIFVRQLDAGGLDNGTIVCTRMLISALILGIFILIRNPKDFKIRAKDIPVLLVGGIIGSSYMNIVYNLAILNVHLALSSVLIGLFALWAVFLGRIFFGEALTARKICCVIIAIAGVVLVSGFFENTDMGALSLFGVAMGVLCGIMYAVCGVATRILGDRGMDPFVMNFYFFLFGSISVLPLCHWDQVATFVSAAPLQGIAWLVSQSLVCAILPYVLFTIAISHMDLGIASTLELVEPAWAMLMGFLLYGENPTVLMVIGVIVVIIAVAMSFRNPKAVRDIPSDPPADPAGA